MGWVMDSGTVKEKGCRAVPASAINPHLKAMVEVQPGGSVRAAYILAESYKKNIPVFARRLLCGLLLR